LFSSSDLNILVTVSLFFIKFKKWVTQMWLRQKSLVVILENEPTNRSRIRRL
jgi:hypothetical protein